MKLLLGDCLEKLKELDDNSVDSVVTDQIGRASCRERVSSPV